MLLLSRLISMRHQRKKKRRREARRRCLHPGATAVYHIPLRMKRMYCPRCAIFLHVAEWSRARKYASR